MIVSKNAAKITNTMPRNVKLTKKQEKSLLLTGFFLFVDSFCLISLQRLLHSGKRRRKCRNQRRCQGR